MCVDCLFHGGNFERHGAHRSVWRKRTKAMEMARLKSSYRTIRDISMGASVITTDLLGCCNHAFCTASEKNSLQYSSQSPWTDPWPLFPLEACKALDNLQVVQKKIWDSARGENRDRRVLDAEFVMFQSFFARLLLRSQKNFCDTFRLWTWAVLRPTSTSVNCRCWSRRSQNIFDIDSKKPLRGNADLAVVSYRIVGSVMMSHYWKRLKSHESWEEHHRGLRL